MAAPLRQPPSPMGDSEARALAHVDFIGATTRLPLPLCGTALVCRGLVGTPIFFFFSYRSPLDVDCERRPGEGRSTDGGSTSGWRSNVQEARDAPSARSPETELR